MSTKLVRTVLNIPAWETKQPEKLLDVRWLRRREWRILIGEHEDMVMTYARTEGVPTEQILCEQVRGGGQWALKFHGGQYITHDYHGSPLGDFLAYALISRRRAHCILETWRKMVEREEN